MMQSVPVLELKLHSLPKVIHIIYFLDVICCYVKDDSEEEDVIIVRPPPWISPSVNDFFATLDKRAKEKKK